MSSSMELNDHERHPQALSLRPDATIDPWLVQLWSVLLPMSQESDVDDSVLYLAHFLPVPNL